MDIVLNGCYGGFNVSDEAMKKLGYDELDYDFMHSDDFRTDPRLVELVKEDSKFASGPYSELYVATIPENATDWRIEDYDGVETLWCVVDGKLC